MSDLTAKLQRLAAFDEGKCAVDALPSLPGSWSAVEKFGHSCGVGYGVRAYRARLAPLIAALLECVGALERECCCPGETCWTTGKPILCDPCEALARLQALAEGGGE